MLDFITPESDERRNNTMHTLKQAAQAYEPKQTKNIADLPKVSVDLLVREEQATDKDGKNFSYKYIEVNGERYRVPNSVLEELKAILEVKPELEWFAVRKSGEGLGTKYKVIQL